MVPKSEIALDLGDRNTKFIDKVGNSRRKHSAIRNITLDGAPHIESSSTIDAIVRLNADLHNKDHPSKPLLEGTAYDSININSLELFF